jgi:hypothetical protein
MSPPQKIASSIMNKSLLKGFYHCKSFNLEKKDNCSFFDSDAEIIKNQNSYLKKRKYFRYFIRKKMLLKTIIFICLGTAISAFQQFNEKEKNAMSHFTNFCLGKPKIDFCSDANLESMLNVLKFEREENMRKAEEMKKQKLQTLAANSKQIKLEQFFAKNPQYKFMSEFGSSRFY